MTVTDCHFKHFVEKSRDQDAGAKNGWGRRERGKSPFEAYCSCAELEAGTSHEVSGAAHKREESRS